MMDGCTNSDQPWKMPGPVTQEQIDAMVKGLKHIKAGKPLVAEIRVNPIDMPEVRRHYSAAPPGAPPATVVQMLAAIVITQDPTVEVGWMHYHDGMGRLIERKPPIGVRREASN